MVDTDRRSSVRYDPDRNSIVTLKKDKRTLLGLVRDESEVGCAAVFQKAHFDFDQNHTLQCSLNDSDFRGASKAWTKELDKKFIKAGITYED